MLFSTIQYYSVLFSAIQCYLGRRSSNGANGVLISPGDQFVKDDTTTRALEYLEFRITD